MPIYKAPLRDMKLVMQELFASSEQPPLPGFENLSSQDIDMILAEAAKFCENILFPLNLSGDKEGCHWENKEVTTPKGFKEAYQEFVSSGWASLACEPEFGGQGLPETIGLAVEEMVCSSNLSFGLYPGLTRGAYQLLLKHGTEDLKQQYLPKMVAGVWSGTMCLTEPHCGTDLGLVRTKALPQSDGSYKLTGTKIFISSGEHDLTENIIHFVLARTPESPAGIRGVSLFLVPKFLITSERSIGERNSVYCDSIEHKMGLKGSATCVMNFEDATGWLVGSLYKGVANMFTMMNSERLAVGNQGLGVAEIAYQNALSYAKERLQGRALTGVKHPEKPADPIIVHPDVRKMLLTMKAYNEGNRMLGTWVAFQITHSHKAKDAIEREEADEFVQLMTPIVKAFMTDCGTDVASLGVQVYGGHGYIHEYGMEQYMRDARIAQIYEGTNGVQALDLVGRKIPTATGRYLRRFFHPVYEYIQEKQNDELLAEFIGPLQKVFDRLQQATIALAQRGLSNPNEIGAAASDYLRMFALTAHAYLWTKACEVAFTKQASNEKAFYESKIETARFFMQKLLPQTSSLFACIMAGSKPLMKITEEEFGPF
jgi:alkylation response protein AidB-like acyl-CoA dehydrogenase